MENKMMVSDVPYMLEMWDFEKNEKAASEMICTSKQQCYWKCKKCGYAWKSPPDVRRRSTGECPCCEQNKVVVKETNDLFTKHPEAAASYDFERNADIDVDTLGCMSKKRVYWKCPKCGYEWAAAVKARTYARFKCPCCDSGKVIKRGFNDVFTLVPELQDWYDFGENDGERIYQVGVSSTELFHWKCDECGRKWVSSVLARIKRDNGQYRVVGCPHYNTVKRTVMEVPVVAAVPSLMKFWDSDKNILDPNVTPSNSREDASWVCSNCGYEWSVSINNQNKGVGKCKCCELRWVVKKGVSDMLTLLPELKDSYDFEKNKEVDVYSLKVVDYTDVWWKCPDCGYEWRSAVRSRVKGKYGSYSVARCPLCRFNEAVIPAASNENIMKFWDFDKNSNLDPQKVSVNSDKIAYWKCKKCDYSWSTSIYLRNKTGKCPQCERSNNFKNDIRKGVNDVLTLVPEMKDIYDFENNDDIDIYHTGVGSKTVVWWKCRECGHRWRGAIVSRTRKNKDGSRRLVGCPECSYNAMRKFYAKEYPRLVQMFDEKRNGVALSEVGSREAVTIKYWWHCPTCGGSFERLISSMANAIEDGRECCPYCRGTEALPGVNSLLAKHPNFAKQWSPNNTVSADYVLPYLQTMAKWCCIKCHGEYLAPISEMVKGNVECPYCTNRKVLPKFNSLQAKYPTVAEMWSPNDEKTADQVLPTISTSALWVCPVCSGEYLAPINEMVAGKVECPYCTNRKVLPKFNSLQAKYPEIAVMWSPNNEKTADQVLQNVSTSAQWVCPICTGEYWAPINEMVGGNAECPYCANRKVLPEFNSLQARYPKIAVMWSPNNEKTADQVLPNVSTSVMWVCPTCAGEYGAPINEMVEGIVECPYCANKKVLSGFNSFAVMHKELMKEWDFLNNYLLADADKIGDRCETAVWWRCKNNSTHQYLMSPVRRLMFEKRHRESCPYCKGLRRKKRHYI